MLKLNIIKKIKLLYHKESLRDLLGNRKHAKSQISMWEKHLLKLDWKEITRMEKIRRLEGD